MWKRIYDIGFAGVGLILLAPVLGVIAVLVRVSDGGPALFKQVRVGRGGKEFVILKFRTMVQGAESMGPSVTADKDPRVGAMGRMLRKTKLDELPQLWNVLRGDMSLVGPRPEVPRYVRFYTADQRKVLGVRPGITDLASLRFRNEDAMLGAGADVEDVYVTRVLPEKLEMNVDYMQRATVMSDTMIIVRTVFEMFRRNRRGVRVVHKSDQGNR